MVFISLAELKNKIEKAIEKGKALEDQTDDVKNSLYELQVCSEIADSPKLHGRTLHKFSKLAEESIKDLNESIKKFFKEKQEKSFEEHGRFEEEDSIEGIDILPEGDWGEDLTNKVKAEIVAALTKREEERKNHKSGAKVKRVPPKDKFDASDVAAALGMEDLAKELTVEHPKPFVTVTKDGPVTRREYVATNDIMEPDEAIKEALSATNRQTDEMEKAILEYEGAKKDKTLRIKENCKACCCEKTDSLNTVQQLELLVGKYTTEKLAAERKLQLAQLALKEANRALLNSNVNSILGIKPEPSEETNKLKEELEKAFMGRRF